MPGHLVPALHFQYRHSDSDCRKPIRVWTTDTTISYEMFENKECANGNSQPSESDFLHAISGLQVHSSEDEDGTVKFEERPPIRERFVADLQHFGRPRLDAIRLPGWHHD